MRMRVSSSALPDARARSKACSRRQTIAGRERTQIDRVERQIADEKARIRLLQAEVSHLEQPARIERLSETYLGLAPASLKHEADVATLPELARKPLALPVKAVEPTPDPTASAGPPAPLATSTQMAENTR